MMNDNEAKLIFERYNPASEVVRCPIEKMDQRKALDAYATAAVNLYGVISRDELVGIFNQQNDDQTTSEEMYLLLLPLVFRDAGYGFYKNYLANSRFFDDFSRAEELLKAQSNKPRYIPSKTEFLQYIHEEYLYNGLMELQDFLSLEPDLGSNPSVIVGEIMDRVINGKGFNQLGAILEEHDVIFSDDKLQEFLKLVQEGNNNTRRWENKGFTPTELYQLTSRDKKAVPQAKSIQRSKVGRNDPCPCGSGKKFKKCCGLYDDAKTAQLSADDCREFYETWYGLMGYVNDREKVIREKIKPVYPNPVSDVQIYLVREVLWKKPELIDEYISKIELPQDRIDILTLWRTKHKKGIMFLVEYQSEFAVALSSNDQKEDILYGVKGISTSLANTMRRALPAPIDTVLLPFKGMIIYDSYLNSIPISFAQGAKTAITELYENVKSQGITTSLD